MTETTEEKKEYTAEELQDFLERSCAAIAKSNAPLAAIENLTTILDILADQSSKIQKLNDGLEAQVSSLTKERDELKEKLSVRLSFTAVMENKNKVISDLEALLSKAEEENKELKEKASSAINCLGEILEAAEEDPNSFLHVEFIQDISLEYGYLSRRCPTQEELADNEWWGHEYEIRADNCVVLDITLPDLRSKGEEE